MARALDNRITRLEQSVRSAVPAYAWTESRAYGQLSEEDRRRLHDYANRFQAVGLSEFTDEELNDFELLTFPFAKEEEEDGK